MTDLEKGYLAAIIDGEGTVTLTKGSSFRYPTIEISSTTLEIVEYLKDHFGGVISKRMSVILSGNRLMSGKSNDERRLLY